VAQRIKNSRAHPPPGFGLRQRVSGCGARRDLRHHRFLPSSPPRQESASRRLHPKQKRNPGVFAFFVLLFPSAVAVRRRSHLSDTLLVLVLVVADVVASSSAASAAAAAAARARLKSLQARARHGAHPQGHYGGDGADLTHTKPWKWEERTDERTGGWCDFRNHESSMRDVFGY